MRKILLALMLLALFSTSTVFAQALGDFVLETRGDTLVLKDFIDMGASEYNASVLTQVFALDDSPPAGRVYELKTNGYYPCSAAVTTPARPVTIIGADNTRLVNNDNAAAALPIICGYSGYAGAMTFADDLTVKNCAVYQIAADGTLGWAYFGPNTADKTLTLDNCLMEHTRWVMVQSNNAPGTKVHINDCYFVNMTGQACRRNGGVYDNVNYNTAEIIAENSTHVMAQGMIYKFRDYQVGKAWFNHNTFVNMGGQVFENRGYLSDWVVTNNIFVNCNVQPYMRGLDFDETDPDSLPMGIINVRALPDSFVQYDRKTLVDKNVIAWSDELSDVVSQVSAANTNGTSEWYDQMITMNTRTQAMFDDDATYPYLTEGVWYTQMPTFTDPQNLFTDQLTNFEDFCVATVDEASGDILPLWRLVYTGAEDYIYSDWPIPIDLSYSDANLLTAATGGFPVGDLNWFPTEKAEWEAQKETEHTALENALNTGADIAVNTNGGFELSPVGVATTIEGWKTAMGGDADAVWEIVDSGAQEGSQALKITINALGTSAWHIETAGDSIPVVPGAAYIMSVWLRSDPTGATVDVTVGNYSYNEYGRQTVNVTDSWQEVIINFTITDQQTYIRAPLHFSKAGNDGKAVYVDNLTIKIVSAIEDPFASITPTDFGLDQNYPNPFNPTTTIEYAIEKPSHVTLKVYNMIGQEVATLVDGYQHAGKSYQVEFDGKGLASGMYIYTLKAGNMRESKKMILMK